jgi:outer membrane protein
MKNLTLTIVLLWAFSFLGTAQNESMSLAQALAYAKENNAQLANAKLAIEDSRQEVKSIVAMGLPQINASGNFTHNIQIPAQVLPDFISPAVYGVLIQEGLLTPDKFRSGEPQTLQFGAPGSITASASMSQLLFDGSYFLGLKAAKEFIKVNELLAENEEIKLVETITKSYYAALIAEQNVKMLQTSYTNLEKTRNETQALYENGFVEKLDVDRLNFALTNLKTQVDNMAFQHKILLSVLKINMGMPVTNSLKLTDPMVYNVKATDGDISVNDRTEIKLLEQQLILDSMNIRRIELEYIPKLSLNAVYQQNTFANEDNMSDLGETWNPGFFYGVNLSIPVFDGFYKKAKKSQAQVKMEQDRLTLESTRNALLFEIQQAELNVQMQKNTLDAKRANKELAREIYRTTKIKYDEGLASSFELIQAETDRNQAEIELSSALYQYIVAQIELEKAKATLNQ